jgi:penicillin-binding protein 2
MKKNKFIPENEIFFEEVVFDSFSSKKELDSLELPLSRKIFFLIKIAIIIIGILTFSRIFYLGIVKNNFYSVRSSANVGKELYLPGNRGVIYDRYGKLLAENKPSLSVSINTKNFFDNSENNKKILAEILEEPISKIEDLILNQNIESSTNLILARNVDSEKIIKLKALNLIGVEIIDDYERYYIDGNIFAHVIGYTGVYKNNEIEGKDGIEAYYNEYLKGIDGKTIAYRDAMGKVFEEKIIQLPESGDNLVLTIDSELQKYFYERFKKTLDDLGRKSGVGIAINPQNGEVLSLFSFPSFDNNIFSESGNNIAKNKILNSTSQPLFNRAISGLYTPASTIKPMVALAALEEKIITPKKQIFSAGFIEIPNPYNPDNPSRFLDWKAHGWVNLYSAIAKSSNIYFYSIGGGFEDIKGLGIEKLREYWQKFGFGKKTGIDLNGEKEGFLPSPQEKEDRKNDIWRIGDTYNVSIGQGDLMVTPIQLISQICAISNGGKFYKPILKKDTKPEILIDFSDLEKHIKEIKIGMGDVVSKVYGTAHMLSSIPVKIGAKTGSSQVANNTKTNAFFVGFMPLENPEIAILILVEDAKEGSLNAVPIAKDTLEWYYWNRLENKKN